MLERSSLRFKIGAVVALILVVSLGAMLLFQREDDLRSGKPFAVVTMFSPDRMFRVQPDEETLSRAGCKYRFQSNAGAVERLISILESHVRPVGDEKSVLDRDGRYDFEVRYKVEFGGVFSDRGDYLFGPPHPDFLFGLHSNRRGQSKRQAVVIGNAVIPPLLALLQEADNFGKPEQRCDLSVVKYSKPENWRRISGY